MVVNPEIRPAISWEGGIGVGLKRVGVFPWETTRIGPEKNGTDFSSGIKVDGKCMVIQEVRIKGWYPP